MKFLADFHSHSTVSDGLDSPTALVRRMRAAGLSVLALTDHDSVDGIDEARAAASECGVELIAGVEISADAPDGDDVHVLGLFVDPRHATFREKLATRQANRRRRGEEMARRIVAAGYPLDLEAIRRDVGEGVWGRPHIARGLVSAGHARGMDDAFDRFLHEGCPWWVPQEKWRADEAVAAIRSAGGVSSLAHAVWYKDPEGLIAALAAAGLDAVEVIHPDHDEAHRERFAALARRHGLLETAGSDFHGVEEKGKVPGAVAGSRAMYDALAERARARRAGTPVRD